MNDDNLKLCLPNWCGYWGLSKSYKLYFNDQKCIAQPTITYYNFPNRPLRPRKSLFGAFHQVDNNFLKFDTDEVQEFNLILFSYKTPYGNYKSGLTHIFFMNSTTCLHIYIQFLLSLTGWVWTASTLRLLVCCVFCCCFRWAHRHSCITSY